MIEELKGKVLTHQWIQLQGKKGTTKYVETFKN
jgi:hypothetical protein